MLLIVWFMDMRKMSGKEVKYQIAQDIQKEYARLMIEENKKEIEKFEYLLLTFEK